MNNERTCIKFCITNKIMRCKVVYCCKRHLMRLVWVNKWFIYKWYKLFHERPEPSENDDRVGRPRTSITKGNEVKKNIRDNRRRSYSFMGHRKKISVMFWTRDELQQNVFQKCQILNKNCVVKKSLRKWPMK